MPRFESFIQLYKMPKISDKQKQLAQFIVNEYPGIYRYPMLKLLYLLENAYLDHFGVKFSEDRYMEMQLGPVPTTFTKFVEIIGPENIISEDIADNKQRLYPAARPTVMPIFTEIEDSFFKTYLSKMFKVTGFDSRKLHDVCIATPRWIKAVEVTAGYRKGKAKILPAKRTSKQSEMQKMRQAWVEHLKAVEKRSIEDSEDHTSEIVADMAPYREQALQVLVGS